VAQLKYDGSRDVVSGTLTAPAPPEIRIECDGVAWATLAALPDEAVADRWTFECRLRPVAAPTSSTIVASSAGTEIGRGDFVRLPLCNGFGLLASDVFGVDHHPFSALPWVGFDGARLTISGMHLPPEGDPGKLRVEFESGVVAHVAYGLPSPEFGTHYWYWPNAARSSFLATIDLAASHKRSDPFHFRFGYVGGGGTGGGKRPVDFWLPQSFTSYVGHPQDPTQLSRVQTWSNSATVTITGYNAFKTLEALFAAQGLSRDAAPSILDWGCGHGRVTTHFIDAWPQPTIFGTDVDAENVAWCRRNLASDRFELAPLWPPLPFGDGTFDGIFGISVMTHLTAPAQDAWLAELARILRPGGIALLTFQADANAAFQSVWRDPAWWAAWRSSGFDADQHDPALDGKIADGTYYRNTTQSTADFRSRCARHFDVLGIEPALFGGYQDCAVLRRGSA
jgi:SAM-dependent methyltransferase